MYFKIQKITIILKFTMHHELKFQKYGLIFNPYKMRKNPIYTHFHIIFINIEFINTNEKQKYIKSNSFNTYQNINDLSI